MSFRWLAVAFVCVLVGAKSKESLDNTPGVAVAAPSQIGYRGGHSCSQIQFMSTGLPCLYYPFYKFYKSILLLPWMRYVIGK